MGQSPRIIWEIGRVFTIKFDTLIVIIEFKTLCRNECVKCVHRNSMTLSIAFIWRYKFEMSIGLMMRATRPFWRETLRLHASVFVTKLEPH